MDNLRDNMESYSGKLELLTSPERVNAIEYLREEDETTLEDLTDYLEGLGYENISTEIIHVHLPILKDYGVVEQQEDAISYQGDEVIEEVIKTLEELESDQ